VHCFILLLASILRCGLTLVASCCVLGVALSAEAQERKRTYNLPRGDASNTLNQFAAASERHVIFMVTKVQGVQTNALAGDFYPAEALQRMLMNTELRAITEPASGAFVVTLRETSSDGPLAKVGTQPKPKNDPPMKPPHVFRRAVAALSLLAAQPAEAQISTPPPAPDEALVLSPFTVRSESDVGYYAANASSATRINKAVSDLPLALNVITSEFMADLNAFSIDEALKYTTGVSSEGFSENTFSIRGFTAGSSFRDGVASPGSGFNTPSSLVDRVEVMKGPSALLYGQGTAGGVVNTVTKKPTGARRNNLRLFYGTEDVKRGEYDFSGPVPGFTSGNWRILHRLTGQYHRGETHLDYQKIEEDVISPMLSFIYRKNTSLTFQYTYQHHINYGHPEAIAALRSVPLTDPRFAGIINVAELRSRIPADVFANLRASPGYADVPHSYNPNPPSAQIRTQNKTLTGTIEHGFTPQISLRMVGIHWESTNFNYQRIGSVETAALPGFVTQQGALRWITQRNTTVQTDLSAKFSIGPVKNQMVLGHLWQKAMDSFELFRDTDLRFPINRAPIFPDDYFLGDPTSIMNGKAVWNGRTTNNNMTGTDFNFFVQNRWSEQERQAAYLIDMADFLDGRLSVLGGVRLEGIAGEGVTKQRGPTYVGAPLLSSVTSKPKQRALGQYAAMFKLIPGLSLYGAYSQSYQPNGAFPDDPQEGSGYDLGLKFSFLNGRLTGRASQFNIDLTNVQRQDLSNPDPASRAIAILTKGEKSRGYEFDLFYAPNENVRFIFSYANIDSAVVDNPESPDLNGQPLVETPRHQLSVFGTYHITSGTTKGLRLGAGANYRDESRSFSSGDRRFLFNPEVTRYDAFVDYRLKLSGRKALIYRLNVKNLTDKVVILHHKWGPGRDWQLSVGYEF
jgi:iron complex outermembrane receptor protein